MSDEIVDGEATEIGSALAVRESAPVNLFRASDPGEVIVKAAETAKPLADVIRKQKLYKTIQGKNHVFVEGWTLLGSMLGVFPVVVWTHKLDNGWEARVEARTMEGNVVGAAEAQCLRTEARWKSADDYALRSMAQTRATSRAMRGPLGFVVQLAGFEPDPAEDMPGGDTREAPTPRKKPARKSAGEPSAAVDSGAADETSPESETSASPAESSPQEQSTAKGDAGSDAERGSPAEESPFKPPTGPRGGQASLIEANELAAELIALCKKLGAVDSIPMVEQKRDAGDIAWLKRQITTAAKAVARQEQGE